MTVTVSMAVIMSMVMIVIVRMIFAMVVVVMMMPTRGYQPHQIDCQSKRTDNQKLLCVHLWRIDQSLNRLEEDKDGDQNEKDAIGEAGKCLDTGVAVSEGVVARPGRHHRCKQAQCQRSIVEEHVDGWR